jgi:hypothetical protein
MSQFYIKNNNGDFVPVKVEQVVSKDWDGKMVWVRLGTDEHPATEEEMTQAQEGLDTAAVLEVLKNTSFLITSYALDFEVLGDLASLKKQHVAVRVTGDDDLSKLGGLQKHAREQLRKRTKKVVILPAPMSVEEYHEVIQIKKRCDLRKSRRGR